jgi:SAM-dependent methyltransferase
LIITRPTNDPIAPRSRVRMVNRHGTSLETRPLLCQVCGSKVWADPVAMPFHDGQFTSVTCLDLLAFVHDDQETIYEFARIVKPGGSLIIRVPNESPTAGFDAFNLCRYLADSTHVGSRPPETDELGWRRHFREREIATMLESAGLRVVESRTTGTGLPELFQLSAMVGFRWLQRSEKRYQKALKIIDRAREVDYRIRTPGFGFSQTIFAVRD